MDGISYSSIKQDLLYRKTIWGLQRLNIAYYISMFLGIINFIGELIAIGIFENWRYKMIITAVYGSFILVNKKINSDISLVKYFSFAIGELLNLVLIYFAYIEEPESALIWIQMASFVVIFYQSYLLISIKSIIIFSIKHTLEWAVAGIYFSSINMKNIPSFLSGVLALPIFMFACTYFQYLHDLDLCYSNKKTEISINKIDALVEEVME